MATICGLPPISWETLIQMKYLGLKLVVVTNVLFDGASIPNNMKGIWNSKVRRPYVDKIFLAASSWKLNKKRIVRKEGGLRFNEWILKNRCPVG